MTNEETDRIIAAAQESAGMFKRSFQASIEGGDGGETEIAACTLADAMDQAEEWALG
jgi:hypothetical protein